VHYDIRNRSGDITLARISLGSVSALSQIQDKTWSKEDLIANWRPITERTDEGYLNGESPLVAFVQTICANQFNPDNEDFIEFSPGWFLAAMGRRFMLSDKSHVGLVPTVTREGDILSVVKGLKPLSS
jgi:hypothetical protein